MAKNLKLNPLIFVTQLGRELNVYLGSIVRFWFMKRYEELI